MKRIRSFQAVALGILPLLLGAALSSGCTLRYSQTLVGEIQKVGHGPVQASDSGTEIGLHPMAVATLSEPESADQLLTVPCDVALGQVDYRSKWYAFYIAVNFPEVEVVSYCVSE